MLMWTVTWNGLKVAESGRQGRHGICDAFLNLKRDILTEISDLFGGYYFSVDIWSWLETFSQVENLLKNKHFFTIRSTDELCITIPAHTLTQQT